MSTVSLEEILIIECIDASEQRNIAVVNIPESFLTDDMYKIIHMMLLGRLADLTAQVTSSIYQKYMRVKNEHKVLYVQLKKYLYITLWAALIFYQKLLKYLEGQGFYLNQYDPFAVKKMVNVKQMMILWHMYILKISYMYEKEVTRIIKYMKSLYVKDMQVLREISITAWSWTLILCYRIF